MTARETFPIGALSTRSGVNIETIRYYERMSLLQKAERSAGGYRLYGASDVARLRFIRRARELGFNLESVRRLLALTDPKLDACEEVRDLAATHLAEVRAKLADLRRMERVLSELVRACERRTTPQCQLLEALAVGTHQRSGQRA